MPQKILLALQYWDGDKAAAMKLLRFITDLESSHCQLADLLLVNRFDCVPDRATRDYASRRFNIFDYTSRRRGVGWPNGCNDLWFSTMEWTCSMLEAGKCPPYKAIFTFEADGAPLFQDWIRRLSFAWDRASAKTKIYVAGPYIPPPVEHINGNALFSCNQKFLNWLTRRVVSVPANVGWDYYLFNAFKQWGAGNIPEIASLYQSKGFTDKKFETLRQQGVAWVHGVKDNSLMECSRAHWLGRREPVTQVDAPSRFGDSFNDTVSSRPPGVEDTA